MVERSQNGWPASSDPNLIHIIPLQVAGIKFPGGCRENSVHWIFTWYLKRFNKEVEKLVNPGCWGFSYRPNKNDPTSLSNHASGTAIDINAPKHPNGKRGTFTAAQLADIKRLCAASHGVLRSGAFYTSTVDAMHLEINVSPKELNAIVAKMKVSFPNG